MKHVVPEGDVVRGRYDMGPLLGTGGQGVVRSAEDLWDRRPVAIKSPYPHLAARADVRRQFREEAWIAARLQHPNIVAVYDMDTGAPVPYLVMERLSGPTLRQQLQKGPLREATAVVLSGDRGGTAKLTDFGIAQPIGPSDNPDYVGHAVGTMPYMAPECLGGEPATVESDLYSVGVMLYESLTGVRPYRASDPGALVRRILKGGPRRLSDLRPETAWALCAIVERAMAVSPERRFRSAEEMACALSTAPPEELRPESALVTTQVETGEPELPTAPLAFIQTS